jgi:hypothetical protein
MMPAPSWWDILDGKTKKVKLDGIVVITSKRVNGNQILNQGRRNKNVV